MCCVEGSCPSVDDYFPICLPGPEPILHSVMFGSHLVDALLDTSVGLLGHLLQGKSVLNSLNGPRHGWRHPLDASLDGALEECNVALPPRCPLGSLARESGFGTGSHQVEGCKGTDTSSTKAEHLTPGSGRNTNGHGCELIVEFWWEEGVFCLKMMLVPEFDMPAQGNLQYLTCR